MEMVLVSMLGNSSFKPEMKICHIQHSSSDFKIMQCKITLPVFVGFCGGSCPSSCRIPPRKPGPQTEVAYFSFEQHDMAV